MKNNNARITPGSCLFLLAPALMLLACEAGNEAPGLLEVAVYGEEFIEEGIPADELIDGWKIDFESFDITIENASAASGVEAPALEQASASSFDLTAASEGMGQLVVSGEVPGGVYDRVAYRVGSMRVVGSATRGEVTKTFAWDIDVPTSYRKCEGLAFVDGAPARTLLTIHADHLFYDDLVSSEPNVAFDLMAAADDLGDGDGEVTQAELAAVNITGQDRYQVGNYIEVTDLWTYVERQSATVGHIDGEGHCGVATSE